MASMTVQLKHAGKNGGCGHVWDVTEAVAEAVRTDQSGGTESSPNKPIVCPNCGVSCRHSELMSTIIREDGQVLCSDRDEAIRLQAEMAGTDDGQRQRIAAAMAVLKAEGVL